MYDVVTIGDSTQDIFLEMTDQTAHIEPPKKHTPPEVCFTFANKVPVHAKYDTVGGNASNAAVSLSRLGIKTAIYTHVGRDIPGERITRELKQNKVNTEYVVTDEEEETNYNTVISLHAERTILVYHVRRKYHLPKIEKAKWFYLTSMSEGSEKLFPEICRYVDQNQTKLFFQPGTYQLRLGAEGAHEILERTDVICMNKEEAEQYTHSETGSDIKHLLHKLRELGPRMVVITNSTDGSYVSDGEKVFHLGVIEDVRRREVTGAGDGFASAFLAALISGETMDVAMRWAQCQASSVIQFVGAQTGLLHERQLHHLLEKYSHLEAKEV